MLLSVTFEKSVMLQNLDSALERAFGRYGSSCDKGLAFAKLCAEKPQAGI